MHTALILEDDASARSAISAIVQRYDWNVLQASTPVEAMQHAAAKGQIELLIADVVLRSGNGGVVARQMIQRRPDLLCVLISGYSITELLDRALIPPDLLTSNRVQFLEKPF